MPEAASRQVIELADYLRETIAELDGAIRDMRAKRTGLAIRLAAIEAATDPEVIAISRDYSERLDAGRPYESAEDARALIEEASRRYSQ